MSSALAVLWTDALDRPLGMPGQRMLHGGIHSLNVVRIDAGGCRVGSMLTDGWFHAAGMLRALARGGDELLTDGAVSVLLLCVPA